VFEGTPLAKPLKCKILAAAGDERGVRWAHHTGDDLQVVLARIGLSPEHIISSGSRFLHSVAFRFVSFRFVSFVHGKQKTLLTCGKQG